MSNFEPEEAQKSLKLSYKYKDLRLSVFYKGDKCVYITLKTIYIKHE